MSAFSLVFGWVFSYFPFPAWGRFLCCKFVWLQFY